MTIAERVARGTVLLDQKMGSSWRKKITEPVRINSLSACVLGQVYGDWGDGCRALGLDLGFECTEYGFDIALFVKAGNYDENIHNTEIFENHGSEADALEEEWGKVIKN